MGRWFIYLQSEPVARSYTHQLTRSTVKGVHFSKGFSWNSDGAFKNWRHCRFSHGFSAKFAAEQTAGSDWNSNKFLERFPEAQSVLIGPSTLLCSSFKWPKVSTDGHCFDKVVFCWSRPTFVKNRQRHISGLCRWRAQLKLKRWHCLKKVNYSLYRIMKKNEWTTSHYVK